MKTLIVSYIASALRKCAMAVAGAGAYIASKGVIDATDAAAVDGATTSIATGLAVIATAIISHLLGKWLADTKSSGRVAGTTAAAPGWALWLCVGASAGLMVLALPACSPGTMELIKAHPVKSCVLTDYGTVCYSSKSGLDVTVDLDSRK